MKTLETFDRELLEKELLSTLYNNPNWWEYCFFYDNFFQNNFAKQLLNFFIQKKREKKLPNYIDFVQESHGTGFDYGPLSWLWGADNLVLTLKDYKHACETLHEDNMRIRLLNAADFCLTSAEYLDEVDRFRAIKTTTKTENLNDQITNYLKKYNEKKEKMKKGEPIGLSTGWAKFNELIAPEAGNYLVLGARPSVGKTTWGVNLAIEAAWLGAKVLFVSIEMSEAQIIDKILARITQEPIWKFRFAKIKNLESCFAEAEFLKQNLTLLNAPRCTSAELMNVVEQSNGYDLVVVDYLQFMNDLPIRGEMETHRLGRISRNLKTIARENNCVMVALAQLNRNSENQKRTPILSDLRDSGCIEQDADVVMLLHRETRQSDAAKLIIAKNRIGSTGAIYYRFNADHGAFRETDTDPFDLEE